MNPVRLADAADAGDFPAVDGFVDGLTIETKEVRKLVDGEDFPRRGRRLNAVGRWWRIRRDWLSVARFDRVAPIRYSRAGLDGVLRAVTSFGRSTVVRRMRSWRRRAVERLAGDCRRFRRKRDRFGPHRCLGVLVLRRAGAGRSSSLHGDVPPWGGSGSGSGGSAPRRARACPAPRARRTRRERRMRWQSVPPDRIGRRATGGEVRAIVHRARLRWASRARSSLASAPFGFAAACSRRSLLAARLYAPSETARPSTSAHPCWSRTPRPGRIPLRRPNSANANGLSGSMGSGLGAGPLGISIRFPSQLLAATHDSSIGASQFR